jgi:hypothetical protein
VITSNQDIRVELNSMPDLTSYFWAYDYTKLFVNGDIDISDMLDQDWEVLQNIATTTSQRGHAGLMGFTYENEGAKYGISITADFNSGGYWLEFIVKKPDDGSLWLVKFNYKRSPEAKSASSKKFQPDLICSTGYVQTQLPNFATSTPILKSITKRYDSTSNKVGDLVTDTNNKIGIITAESSSTQWLITTVIDGSLGGGTGSNYGNTDGTLNIDNTNYLINSISQQTKYDVSGNFTGNINANYNFSLFDNDSENYIYYDKWTKNLSVNLNVYPSFKKEEITNWELAKIISLHIPNLKLKLGTYSITGFYHDNLNNTQNKVLNGLCFITQDETTGTLLNFALSDTANFPQNTGEKFIINFNFQLKKEIDN